jgi:hypothetical protein
MCTSAREQPFRCKGSGESDVSLVSKRASTRVGRARFKYHRKLGSSFSRGKQPENEGDCVN